MAGTLLDVKFALQNGEPIIVRDVDYESRCCCGLPCIQWTRYARRLSTPVYANAPPPTFPCCGLLESYSVDAQVWEINFARHRITGPITVTALRDVEGVWTGEGGTLEIFSGSGWEPFYLPIAFASILHRPTSCEYQLLIGGRSSSGSSGDVRGIFRKSFLPLESPIGFYPHQTIVGSATVS